MTIVEFRYNEHVPVTETRLADLLQESIGYGKEQETKTLDLIGLSFSHCSLLQILNPLLKLTPNAVLMIENESFS